MIHRAMFSRAAGAVALLLTACLAQAHFTFIVPRHDGAAASVFLSETIQPDPNVDVGMVAGSKLFLRDAAGHETPLTLTLDGDVYATPLPGGGNRLVHGISDLGVMNRGKAHLLLYYPKAIVGDAFEASSRVGDDAAVEIVPEGEPGAVKLLLLGRGKPLGSAEITVLLPDGSSQVLKTGPDGRTQPLTQKGRFGAWARYWEDAPGERDGARYEQVRHYATLVFDAPSSSVQAAGPETPPAEGVLTLPEPTSSFGAIESDGWLYIYGGHIAPTHVYSTEAVSGRFHRVRLQGEPRWEELPSGPALQGMNLAAHDGLIYRVGGMEPRNAPGQPADNHSVADCARFDPASNRWEPIPPLPAPRSSHDLVVLGDSLLVVGGWTMLGNREEWAEDLLEMDLSAKEPAWRSIPAPFQRRALMAAAFQGKLYVVGGFNDHNQIQRAVSIYDPRTQQWSDGPELPEGPGPVGFAPAVGVHRGRLYVSVSDGALWRLDEAGHAWEKAGQGAPRVAHRLAFQPDAVLILGGAAGGGNLDTVDVVPLGATGS
ncbi:MAG: hypothetical protein GC160_26235 [Acidobacteria bacterium]|nr:hypothetical protein [Acidobacteriota bacterium]